MRFMKNGLVYDTTSSQTLTGTDWCRSFDLMEMYAFYVTPNGKFWHIHLQKPRRWFKWLTVERDQEMRGMYAHKTQAEFLAEIANIMGHEEAIRVGEQLGALEA